MEVNKVSQESLKKAMEALGLIEKAEATEQVIATTEEQETEKNSELEKAEQELALAQAKVQELKNPKKVEERVIVKSEINEELIKGFNDKIGAIATLVQAKDKKIEELSKALTSVTEFNKALAAKIGMIEKTPLDRKSVTTQSFVEKFEKAEGGEKGVKNVKVLSISNGKHRAEIADELFKAATANGPEKIDMELAKASQNVELRQVTPQIQQRLLKDFGIQVVR